MDAPTHPKPCLTQIHHVGKKLHSFKTLLYFYIIFALNGDRVCSATWFALGCRLQTHDHDHILNPEHMLCWKVIQRCAKKTHFYVDIGFEYVQNQSEGPSKDAVLRGLLTLHHS